MLKPFLKLTYYNALSLTMVDSFRIRKIKNENKLAILNLHRVSNENNPFWPPMSPKTFEALLEFLQKNFEVCLFSEIREKQKSKKPLAILSFDDGYYDFIEFAEPLLQKFQMKANMNIIPHCVETGEAMWNIILYDFLNFASAKSINEIELPNFDVKLSGESYESKMKFGLQISRYLKMRPRKERKELWQNLQSIIQETVFNKTKMMSLQEIKQISQTHEIGAHSYSHESMGHEDFEYFVKDYENCKIYFDKKLKLPLEIYAFPNGSYNKKQVEYLNTQEVKHILLVDEDFSNLTNNVHKRITVYGESKLEVTMKALNL